MNWTEYKAILKNNLDKWEIDQEQYNKLLDDIDIIEN